MNNIDGLINFGLTRQEATVYEALLIHGAMNGYELAKRTGISRSNAYTTLDRLVERGAAYLIEGDSLQYTPVSVNEFCSNRIRNLEIGKKRLLETMPKKRDDPEGYITIRGRSQIIDKMRTMIRDSEKRVYISAPGNVLEEINLEIAQVIERGTKMVIISQKDISVLGATMYLMDKPQNSIRLIVDSQNVLTGDIEEEDSTCLYSNKKNLVELMKDSLRNEIDIIEMKRSTKENE
jgi:sugar-specific transcriptional regulator TrmB